MIVMLIQQLAASGEIPEEVAAAMIESILAEGQGAAPEGAVEGDLPVEAAPAAEEPVA